MLNEIVKMFKERGGFVSGEELSKRFGITRAAIWKKIEALREKGYKIEGSTAKGYRLVKTPEFSVEELKGLIQGDIGSEIVFFESIDSTNAVAMKLAEKGAVHGTVVIADSQTKGKGRLGRSWVSPGGANIYMSIILRPEIQPRDATLLTIMSAVASATAIRNASGLMVKIKWPNDLMASDRKLGGILTEMKSDPDRVLFAVVGIGVNVNMNQKDFPSEIRALATSIKEELGSSRSRTVIISEILKETGRCYNLLLHDRRSLLLDEWKNLSSTLNRKVKVSAGKDSFTGIAEDIDDEGMLILRLSSGALKRISAGDVTLLR